MQSRIFFVLLALGIVLAAVQTNAKTLDEREEELLEELLVRGWWSSFKEKVSNVVHDAGDWFKGAWNTVTDFVKEKTGLFRKNIKSSFSKLEEEYLQIRGKLNGTEQLIAEWMIQAAEKIKQKADFLDDELQYAKDLKNKAKDEVEKIADKIKDKANDLSDDVKDAYTGYCENKDKDTEHDSSFLNFREHFCQLDDMGKDFAEKANEAKDKILEEANKQ